MSTVCCVCTSLVHEQDLQVEKVARENAEEKQAEITLDCQMARAEVARLQRTLADFERYR